MMVMPDATQNQYISFTGGNDGTGITLKGLELIDTIARLDMTVPKGATGCQYEVRPAGQTKPVAVVMPCAGGHVFSLDN